MQVFVYKALGGKDIILDEKYSSEVLAVILTVLETVHRDSGVQNLTTKPIVKNTKHPIFEIKRGFTRIFFWIAPNGDVYIPYIIGHKQKNKIPDNVKATMTSRLQNMLTDVRHCARY